MADYRDAINEALERLDDLGYERGAEGDLANHGPMGAEVLATLGYGDQVADWVDGYRQVMAHHDPPSPRFTLDARDEQSWRSALGSFDRAGDWEQLFSRELSEAPWREVLGVWWPRLFPGVMAGLTHGLIRTAHAVRGLAATPAPTTAQLTELARGLAYWAARYAGLPGTPALQGTSTVSEIVANLPREPLPEQTGVASARARFGRVGTFPGYHDALAGLAPLDPQWLLSEMTSEFAGIYLAHEEISPVPLIHGVTAPAAVRLVLPHLPQDLQLPTVTRLWQVHVALLLAFTGGRDTEATVDAEARSAALPFDELPARAVEHGDEHVLKFTEACLGEHSLRPDARYAAAAAAAIQRIPAR